MKVLIASVLVLIAIPTPAQSLSAKKKGVADFKMTVSATSKKSAIGTLAQSTVFKAEKKRYEDLLAEAVKLVKPGSGEREWSYESLAKPTFQTSKVISYVNSSYTYTGGAHGIGVTRTYNFATVNNKPTQIKVWDVIQPSMKNELKLLLLGNAAANNNTDWVQDGSQDFLEVQLQRFHISKDGLVWEFDPYELGSYAAGAFSFTLKWDEIRHILRPHNPIASVMN